MNLVVSLLYSFGAFGIDCEELVGWFLDYKATNRQLI